VCKRLLLILVVLFSPLLCYSEEASSQDALQQINSQAKLAQNIVVRLVESLNLREATLLKDQENFDKEKIAFQAEKLELQNEKSELQKEKDYIEKQKKEQPQTEQTLLNLDKSYQTLLASQKRNETLLWCLGGVSAASIATTIIVALVK